MQYILSVLIGFVLAVGTGPIWIPFFRKLRFGQFIREEGPTSHLKKGGTPTFGGIIFIVAFIIGAIVLSTCSHAIIALMVSTLLFAIVGFLDDYQKVIKKNNLGLTAKQKMLALIAISLLLYGVFFSDHHSHLWNIYVFSSPFIIALILTFVAISITNAVNLTDGIDGLCASVTAVVALFFLFYSLYCGQWDLAIGNGVMLGALLGYVLYNWHPAKVFMGDTGSLALGGYVFANAVILNIEWFIPLFGLLYVLEALSVVIQVIYFKATNGKRFFRMSPLHHHFELGGWREQKIVFIFSAFTAVACMISYFILTM